MNTSKSIPRWKFLTDPEDLLKLKRLRDHPDFTIVYEMLEKGRSIETILTAVWRTNRNPRAASNYIQKITELLFVELYTQRYAYRETNIGSKSEPYCTEDEAMNLPKYDIVSLSPDELSILKKIVNNESEVDIDPLYRNGEQSIKTVGSVGKK